MSTYKAPSCSVENPYTPAPRAADPGAPDPEELMSRDQIEALQFERLRWTLHYAYENVPAYKVHNAYGYSLFTGGLGAHYGAEYLGAAVIPMSGGQTEKQVQLIRDFEPDAILSTPTYLLTIADAFRKLGIDPKETSLKTAVLGAEPWTEEMRREIIDPFDDIVLDLGCPGRMGEMTVRIERREEFTLEAAEEAGKRLLHDIKTKIGSTCRIEVLDPDVLPRSVGKIRRIYDYRNKPKGNE